jgi:hypothetical protein
LASHYTLLLDNAATLSLEPLNYSLHDLLIKNAIDHLIINSNYTTYKSARKSYPFRDSLAFVSVQDFIRFDFAVSDETAKRIQVYKLYQELLRTYLKSGQRNLLAKFDLERMQFGLQNSYHAIRRHNSYYLGRLIEMEQHYSDVPMGTTIS